MKKIKFSSELAYIVSIIVLAFSVAMLTSADFGISMIVAPAYILSQKLTFLTFGQAEYVIQAIMFIVLCFIIRKFKWTYFFAFITCLIYGAVLDLWRLIPIFNQSVITPDKIPLYLRIIFFVLGELLTAFSIALCFKTYLPPQVYDFAVKAITSRYNLKVSIVKYSVDVFFLILAIALSFIFFGRLVGVSFGTIILVLTNGFFIGLFNKLLDKAFEFKPSLIKLSKYFED